MTFFRLSAGRLGFVRAVIVALLTTTFAIAADQFPFDQELLLDAAPMRPGKRMPTLTVAPNGDASIGLWCKSVIAHIELSDDAIKIEAGPLPDALPEMMGRDQCTPARVQADGETLETLIQATNWRLHDGALVLTGPKTLKFRAATN